MIDLLLIRPNDQEKIYTAVKANTACEPPLWAAVIAAFIRDKGLDCKIIDAEALNQSPEVTCNEIEKIQPRLVGIIITGTNLSASTQKMNGAGILARTIKERDPDMPLFMWGLHPSALPEQTLKEEAVDFVIKGESLESIYSLARDFVEHGGFKRQSDGIYCRENGGVKGDPKIGLISLDEMPSPAWDLLPMERYAAHNWHRMGEEHSAPGYGVIATTLGCPFSCSFCAVSSLFGQHRVRFKDPEKVIEEIDDLILKYQVHFIKIIDECFVLNKEYVRKICDLLIARNYDLNIWAYARVDTVDEAILKKLRDAGVKWLAFGIESPEDDSLAGVDKGQYGRKEIEKAVRMTKEADINVLANFMFGLPNDDYGKMENTLAFARHLNPEFINLNCTMAYPGSELYYECLQKGLVSKNWLEYAQLSYECRPLPTEHLTLEQVLAFRDKAFYEFFRNNDAYYYNIRRRFGEESVAMIEKMLENKLKRKILGD